MKKLSLHFLQNFTNDSACSKGTRVTRPYILHNMCGSAQIVPFSDYAKFGDFTLIFKSASLHFKFLNKGIPSHFLTCILGNNFFVKHVGRGVTLRGNSLAQTLFWKSTLAEAFKSCILQLCSLQTKKNIYSTKQSTELWCTTKFWNCSRYFYDQNQHLCIQEKLLYATIFVFESSLRLTKQRR